MSYMRPHVSGTERVGFSKQDACGNLVVDSLPVNFPLSAFCQWFLVRTSVGLNTIHTFLSHKNSQTDAFLCDLGLAKLHVQLGYGIPKGFPNLWIRLIVACLMTASSRFAQGNSVSLLCYKILCSGILNVPLPYGMRLKVSHEGHHIFEQLHPQQHKSAVDVTCDSQGWSLSIPFSRLSGSGAYSSPLMVLLLLGKVVLLRYSLCMWLPCRKRDIGANTSNKTGRLQNPLLVNQKKNSWLKTREKLSSYVARRLSFLHFLALSELQEKKLMANLVKYAATEACTTNTLAWLEVGL